METYRANHPEVRIWEEDIRGVQATVVLDELGLESGELDLLAGCPPCQGFSAMRTQNGHLDIQDDRNDLVFEFLRFVEGLRPRAIMMENVPALADDERFTTLCKRFRDLGYHPKYGILNAMHYGVPQRRRRLVLLACLDTLVGFASPADSVSTVRDAIHDLPAAGDSGDPPHDLRENRTQRIRELIAAIPKDGGSRTALPDSLQLKCHKKCNGYKDVYGRMAWDKPAPTITGGCFNPSKGRFLHPEENRAITMREAALLQSFPADYTFPNCRSKSALALLIGNALPPEFIRRHAQTLREHLNDSESRSLENSES